MTRTRLRALAPAALATACALLSPAPSLAAGIGQASPAAGRLDVVFRHDGNGTTTDTNRDSLVQVTRTNGTWSSPVNLGGSIHADADLSLTSRSTNTLDLAVRWNDDTIRHRTWSSASGWGSWTNLGGAVTGGPSIAAYGPDKLALAFRNSSGTVTIRTWTTAGGWTAGTALPTTVKAGTGPALVSPKPNELRLVTVSPSDGNAYLRSLTSGNPETGASWSANTAVQSTTYSWDATPAISARGHLNAAAADAGTVETFNRASTNRSIIWAIQSVQPWANLGSTVASSPSTARPGESTLANGSGATWSQRLSSGSTPQLDLIFRKDDGCLWTRTKTNTANTATWAAQSRIPTVPYSTRCTWPSRTATPSTPNRVPLMKRSSTADTPDYQEAHDAYLDGVGSTRINWFNSRYDALTIDYGSDWATSWLPRNWHPNTWVYRKGTSYLATANDLASNAKTEGPDVQPDAKAHFVKLTNGNYAAVNYSCWTQAAIDNGINTGKWTAANAPKRGCTQPLLNLTDAAARNYWLKGLDGKVPDLDAPVATDCQGYGDSTDPNAHKFDGVLDLLACKIGNPWPVEENGNVKGVWIDDALAQLASSTVYPTAASHIADYVTGEPVLNNQLSTKLPAAITQTAWENGMATMFEDLKAGIASLKAQNILAANRGQVAINYKWHSYGWGDTPSITPTISDTSAAARIIKAATFVELEGGWIDGERYNAETQTWGGGLRPGGVTSIWSFERKRQFVREVHRLGTKVLEEKTNSGDVREFAAASCLRTLQTQDNATLAAHYTTAQFNLAATMLEFQVGDMVGDMCEYYARGWDGYQSDLGLPTGPATTLASGLIQRNFENGRVIVAPPNTNLSPITESLGGTFKMRPNNSISQTPTNVTSVSLKPFQGAVLLNP